MSHLKRWPARLMIWLGAVAWSVAIAWVAIPSRAFLHIGKPEYLSADTILFPRVPRTDFVWLKWTIEGQPSSGPECNASSKSYIQRYPVAQSDAYVLDHQGHVVATLMEMPPGLRRCAENNARPTAFVHQFQVLLWGWLPLRPYAAGEVIVTIEPDG